MESLTQNRVQIVSFVWTLIHSYFRPIHDFFHYIVSDKPNTTVHEIRRDDKNTDLLRHASHVMAKAVCLNQGRYLEFAYLSADLNRRLSRELRKSPADLDGISESARNLVDHLNEGFYEAAKENFALLHAYFDGRASLPPRICIKGNFRTGATDRVITVFRDTTVQYRSDVRIELNSGFAYIHKEGRYFLENDTFSAACHDRYFNPRLDNDRARQLAASGRFSHEQWVACWAGAQSDSDAYRSTLIIPMTLRNSELDEAFKARLNFENAGRTIFGYLCFDHVESNYFRKEPDVSLGYAFADLLSMYVFARTLNIDISATFAEAEKILSAHGRHREVAKLSENHVPKTRAKKAKFSKNLRFDLYPSKKNSLISLDIDLLRYVGATNGVAKKADSISLDSGSHLNTSNAE